MVDCLKKNGWVDKYLVKRNSYQLLSAPVSIWLARTWREKNKTFHFISHLPSTTSCLAAAVSFHSFIIHASLSPSSPSSLSTIIVIIITTIIIMLCGEVCPPLIILITTIITIITIITNTSIIQLCGEVCHVKRFHLCMKRPRDLGPHTSSRNFVSLSIH